MSLFANAAKTPYKNRDALKDKFVPSEIVGREVEKREYVNALKPVLNGFSPDNVFLIGPSGVGKTALTRHVLSDLKEQNGMDHLTVRRVNCDGMGGETTLMLEIANLFRDPGDNLATTGYKKARARDLMFQELNRVGGTILLVLDELDTIDELDTFLYQVPRAHETGKLDPGVDVGLIGISNDPRFLDDLPDDVQNTLTDVTIQFSEYDANELRAVLRQRAALAFKDTEVVPGDPEPQVESEVLTGDIVPLAAAYATKNTGDARMAIRLLRNAGDLARDEDTEQVTRDHLDHAMETYEQEQIVEAVERLEDTAKIILYALVTLTAERDDADDPPRTREIAERYHLLHSRAGNDPVSTRQVRKHLSKFDNIGLTDSAKQKGGGSGTYTERSLNYEPDVVFSAISDVVKRVGIHTSVETLAQQTPAGAD
jgi:cell division control protein 6